MLRRCKNPVGRNNAYLAIRVCQRWRDSFDAFCFDMGPRPTSKHEIDRIDGERDYGPDNCRWATEKEQQRNRWDNRRIEYNGHTATLAEWAELANVKYMTLFYRLKRGWGFERALMTPPIAPKDVDRSYIKRDAITGRLKS